MSLQEKLETLFVDLKRVPSDEVEVRPTGDGRFMVTIVSSAFEGLPEEDRQDKVWRVILDNLSDYEQSEVEFVFTNSPSEMVDAGEANER